jgi:hypothetical protein
MIHIEFIEYYKIGDKFNENQETTRIMKQKKIRISNLQTQDANLLTHMLVKNKIQP